MDNLPLISPKLTTNHEKIAISILEKVKTLLDSPDIQIELISTEISYPGVWDKLVLITPDGSKRLYIQLSQKMDTP